MAIHAKGTTITVDAPGDTGQIVFSKEDDTPFTVGDQFIFGVRHRYLPGGDVYLLKKTVTVQNEGQMEILFTLLPADTANLTPDVYRFGLRMVRKTDGVTTVLDTKFVSHPFRVLDAVVNDS